MFAIVFGLSMDYEVFLISRVHEEWEHTRDASGSVARGLQTTGRVITAAASIMIVVFASFALGDDRIIKLFGIGLASAVFFDAVIIRCLLVPAIMEILGRARVVAAVVAGPPAAAARDRGARGAARGAAPRTGVGGGVAAYSGTNSRALICSSSWGLKSHRPLSRARRSSGSRSAPWWSISTRLPAGSRT